MVFPAGTEHAFFGTVSAGELAVFLGSPVEFDRSIVLVEELEAIDLLAESVFEDVEAES